MLTLNKINILICDDQKSNVEFLNVLLKKYFNNINIFKVFGGAEAIDILKNNNIHILLLDIDMPNVDGWEVAKFIQNDLSDKNIATIFITSVYLAEKFSEKGFELGAVDYISKPINQNLLINRLRLYMRNYKQEEVILEKTNEGKEKDRLLLQKEIILSQSNLLEKIAHHWRQPLSVISTHASMIEYRADANIEKDEIIKSSIKIMNVAQELSKIINQFKTFFQPEDNMKIYNVKKVINSTLQFLRFNLLQNHIKLVLKIENVELFGYENEFKQVIISLLNNSIDALNNDDIEDKFIKIEVKTIDDVISISITDTGGGISSDIVNRIYEPYFTTKHEYSGTGLSLHLSKQVVHRYLNGTLNNSNTSCTFKNKKYNCTKFTININE